MTTSSRAAALAASIDIVPTSSSEPTGQVAGEPPKLSPQRAKVFEYMSANPRATGKECAAATGLSFGSVRQHQFRLRTAGLIPPVLDGSLRGASLRALIARHEESRRRILDELEVIAAAEQGVPALLDPGRRRRQRAKLRRLEARLRHHESRLTTLEMLLQTGPAP